MKMELNNFTDLEKISPLASSRTHGVVSERKVQAVGRAGQAVNMAVERFITIGELIADDNPEIKSDMYSFCRDARDAGKSIEHLCEISTIEDMDYLDLAKRSYGHTDIVIASRSLLSSITRVLLLVDIVVVKQLLTAKRKITKSLEKLESIMNFAEFVRAFSVFGLEMIELAYLTGNQQNRLKEERHRAQMFSARQMLEHSITILITSSRNSLVHGDCLIAKENRDTVFCQIRRAMDLIHFVIKDSIFDGAWFGNSSSAHHQPTLGFKNGENGTIFTTLKHLNYLMESLRQEYKISEKSICMANNNCNKLKSYNDKSWYNDCLHQRIPYHSRWDCGSRWLDAEALPLYNSELKEQLLLTFEKLLEKTHDFTDSAYTSHMYRENILLHCDRCKLEFNKYYNKTLKNHQYGGMGHIDTDIDCVLNAVKSLSKQLVLAVTNQANELLFSLNMSINLLDDFRAAAMQQDLKRLEEQSNRFHDYSDHIIDVCKLLQHIAFTETLQVQAKCLAMNLRIYGPQILTAVKILFKYPDSDAALENFDAFAKMWKWLTTEMNALAKQVIRTTNLGADGRPDAYNTSENFDVAPYAGKSSAANAGSATVPTATAAVANPTTATAADGTQAPNELSKFDELNPNDNNDILKRAKNMSAMAFSMYQFTKGSGTLKTTQDLFTQAEYFAEEANRLYKVLRQFSYQVPASPNKKDLLNILDRVPTFVQTLQFTVKDHTVGKAATFVKVDHVIKETKELMSVINKVVEKCFECANKFKLDFTGITGDIASCSSRGDDCNASGMGDSKGTTNSSEGSM